MTITRKPAAKPAPTEAPKVVRTFGKVAFQIRLEGLLAERATLDSKIEEMQQWIALCDAPTEASA